MNENNIDERELEDDSFTTIEEFLLAGWHPLKKHILYVLLNLSDDEVEILYKFCKLFVNSVNADKKYQRNKRKDSAASDR